MRVWPVVVMVVPFAMLASCGDDYQETPSSDAGADAVSPSEASATDAPTKVDPAACRSGHAQADGGCDPLIFVTADPTSGNIGGLAKADAFCEASAKGGTFRAWLSSKDANAITRVTDGNAVTRPARLSDGTLVVDKLSDLGRGTIKHAIDRTAQGGVVPAEEVWTGTDRAGAYSQPSCDAWMPDGGMNLGRTGKTDRTDVNWTDTGSTENCTAKRALYCVEIVK